MQMSQYYRGNKGISTLAVNTTAVANVTTNTHNTQGFRKGDRIEVGSQRIRRQTCTTKTGR